MEWLNNIFDLIMQMKEGMVYLCSWFLMLLESTVIPVPSEFVVTPAAYRAASGDVNILLIIILATIGADMGATINYVAGFFLGRPIIYKFANSKIGHLCLLNQEKVEKSEKYFENHGKVATITGRLVPGIRHLISIPAGLSKMNYWKFLLYTTIGAGVWNCILAALGWYLYTLVPADALKDQIEYYSEYIKFAILAIVAFAIVYFLVKSYIKSRNKA